MSFKILSYNIENYSIQLTAPQVLGETVSWTTATGRRKVYGTWRNTAQSTAGVADVTNAQATKSPKIASASANQMFH